MSKERFILRWCLVCMVSYLVAMQITSQAMSFAIIW